jgi:aconitate hydratase
MSEYPFNSLHELSTNAGTVKFHKLSALEIAGVDRLPFSMRVLLESVVRQIDGRAFTEKDAIALASWQPNAPKQPDVPFLPARVIMQDLTGVPAIVDLAAMRSALDRLGGDPAKINPVLPVDLVIDHSVQVDFFASSEALRRNAEIEFQRNKERYEFLRWGTDAFDNFRVVPPATGIVHQVNLEYLAKGVLTKEIDGETVAFPDTLVGTDSHTPMVNGLGVLGWGVGGIEAEAAILGYPGSAACDGSPRSRRLQARGRTAGGYNRNRSGSDRNPAIARTWCGRKVCGILWNWTVHNVAPRSSHHWKYGPRVWRDGRFLSC